MKKDIKNLWVQALRSGKYKQGYIALREGNTYSALGVLCDLYRINEDNGYWTTIVWDSDPVCYWFRVGVYTCYAFVPTHVSFWSGLDTGDGRFYVWDRDMLIPKSVLGLNDKEGLDFNQIADKIDKYL